MSVTAVPLQPVKRSYKTWLWAGIVLAIAVAVALAWTGTRASVAAKGDDAQFLAWNKGQIGVQTAPSGLQYQVLKEGTGPKAQDGDGVKVFTTGTLRDGTIFQPAGEIPLQVGGAIPGFDEALKMMSKGGKMRVWIPSSLAYDKAGPQHPLYGKLLQFDLEIKDLIPAEQLRQMMMQQQMMQQMQGQGGAPGGPQGGPPPGGPEVQ
ncbi:FKBP-type peptidyl-prolyl cis-trans isomerase [Sphingomonas sp. HITSZ_GF]|uniref:FKBP-type peptidyl-prolyl cis-trans isomerase n=1 Tax=Sphingomonas sp. HITSZ_GF TaxID=3037247 RepID=UPI00240D3746|nr:FKBP-type peptidyl-prolyl cis-trans isomerase [Sphingomonas sp. HITSZ_GF]MDG2535785.1 FKBP-type peptidyl-prolyl cis-trans isomerase [Sphingomonas sp. HITSZ_GF]